MIRLQTHEDDIDSILQGDNHSEESLPETNIENFSVEVFKTLLGKQIAPLPLNYQVYFESLLNTKDVEFQRKIHELMESADDHIDDERNIAFEKSIHSAFSNITNIMRHTATIYKNLAIMNDIEKKWTEELVDKHPYHKYIQDTEEVQHQIDIKINQLKIMYQQCKKILEDIHANSIYDAKFNTYNKRYFIYLVQSELKQVVKFSHISTITMMSLPLGVTRYLQNDQTTALIVMKTVAKLLLKTSRRSDLIGYVGNGIFGMLLKHSDLFSTQKASDRLIDLMKNTNVFLDKREIRLDLNIGIAKLKADRSAEESLNGAITALRMAQKQNVPYMIFKDDKG